MLNNNEIKISNISKDLKDQLIIENNIFGYKIERSEILEKKNCDNFDMKLIDFLIVLVPQIKYIILLLLKILEY